MAKSVGSKSKKDKRASPTKAEIRAPIKKSAKGK
jgi:hypothetical protein